MVIPHDEVMTMLAPVRQNKLSDQVFEQLRDEILSKKIKPGDRLPAERELCDVLQVNRGSVREALKRLEQARLIRIQHGSGSVVLDLSTNAGFDMLGEMIMPGGKMDFVAVRGIFEFRALIGPEAARLAARRIHDSDLEKLAEILKKIEGCPADDFETFQELDYEFYEIIVQASENLPIILITNSVRDLYLKYKENFIAIFERSIKMRNEIYHPLMEALAARDEELSQELMHRLISEGNRAFFKKYFDKKDIEV
jgi:DNA-binding FadR family transcriptional regulator